MTVQKLRLKVERNLTKTVSPTGFVVLIALIFCLCMTGCGKKDDVQQTTAPDTKATQTSTEPTTEAKSDEPLATVFFVSDYQQEEGWPAPADTLRGILGSVKEAGEEPETFAFLGDYTNDRNLHDYQLSPAGSIAQIREVVEETFPAVSVAKDEAGETVGPKDGDVGEPVDSPNMIFVQGNHDAMGESITPTGLLEYDDYLIYVLNTQNDFPWKQGKTSGSLDKVKKASAEMKKCFDGLIEKGEKRPLFIAGHVPLQFTARTSSRHTTGDNLYSSLVFDVVNEAGKSLDIVYLFGHDHSKGWDCYLGGASVYRAVGDVLLLPDFDEKKINTDKFSEEKLNFTYMNAGYTGYYMNCGSDEYEAGQLDQYHAADETLTGTVFRIWPDRLEVNRYSPDGIHPMGWEGQADPYKGGIDEGLIDEKYYSQRVESPQTVGRR